MNKVYTIIEAPQDGAITLSHDNVQTTIVLQEYSEEKYKEFLNTLEMWDLLFIDKSYAKDGIETGDYQYTDYYKESRLPLNPDNILVKNNEVIGFVLGKKHYPNCKLSDGTVLMFFDGTSIGNTEYEHSYIWGDRPSDTTYYHDHYVYKLVKKTSFD